MTNEEVRNEMSHELNIWCMWNDILPMCAEEALIEYADTLTRYQRSYLTDFCNRWFQYED